MKSLCKNVFLAFILMSSIPAIAGQYIGFGTIKGYSIGANDANEINVYLNDGYTNDAGNCNGAVKIKYSDYDGTPRSEKRLDQMMSTILAAYVSGKKIRFHSHKNNCDVTWVKLQETIS